MSASKRLPIDLSIGFKLGRKEVHLPNFTITLIRSHEFLPPTFATFIVPLHFNKFDLRDYLYHLYDIKAVSIRSFVRQQKVRHGNPRSEIPRPKQWFRPRSIKKMIVEMEHPFVWPEEPTDYEPWAKKTWDAAQKDQKEYQEARRPKAKQEPTKERESIAAQAQRLLKGEDRWKGTTDVAN